MAPFKQQLEADLKAAMIARDSLTVDTLKGVKTAILYEEVAKGKREMGLDETAIERIIIREAKKRDEAAVLYEQGGNPESAAKERAEKAILARYLPKQLSEAEVVKIIEQVVAHLKPEGMKDMGRVIGEVKSRSGTAADGALVARLVKETLQ